MISLSRKPLAKNFFWLILCIFIPILILNVYYIVYWSEDMKRQEIEKDAKFLSLIGQSLDTILNDITQYVSVLEFDNTFNDAVDGLIEPDGGLSPSRYIYLNSVMDNTFRAFLAKPYIRSAYFYHEKNDEFIFTTEGIRNLSQMSDLSWLDSYRRQAADKNYWAEVRDAEFPNSPAGSIRTISLFRKIPIFNLQPPGRGTGVIVLNLETKYFDALIADIPDAAHKWIYIMDGNHQVLYRNSGEELYAFLNDADIRTLDNTNHMIKTLDNRSYLVSYIASRHYDWRYVSIFPIDKMLERLDVIKRVNAVVVVLSLAIGIVLTYRYTSKNYKPIRTMVEIIRHSNEGKDISRYKLPKDDDYGYITLNIVRNFIEKKEIQTKLAEHMLLQRETELFALQSQINPHFIYNMLEAINWEAIDALGRTNPVSNLLLLLSSNLRYVTDHTRSMVTFEEDLQHLQNYVNMQQIMKEDGFEFTCLADDRLLSCSTLKLLLQPLVENSIQHGLSARPPGGRIRLLLDRHGDSVRIRLTDNGCGMDRSTLRRVREDAERMDGASSSKGLGIRNIHRRIRLKFGEDYGLRIASKAGWGTAITLRIPLLRERIDL